jgi:hypothetical protein
MKSGFIAAIDIQYLCRLSRNQGRYKKTFPQCWGYLKRVFAGHDLRNYKWVALKCWNEGRKQVGLYGVDVNLDNIQ